MPELRLQHPGHKPPTQKHHPRANLPAPLGLTAITQNEFFSRTSLHLAQTDCDELKEQGSLGWKPEVNCFQLQAQDNSLPSVHGNSANRIPLERPPG